MTRTQWILTGVLAVQVLFLVMLAPWSGSSAGSAPVALLPMLADLDPSKIVIDDGDESLAIERAGESWGLPDSEGYPVDEVKLLALLDDLESIRVRRPIVSSTRYHETLKVTEDDNERRLRIWGQDGDDPAVDLLLGTSSNYRVNHARVVGDDRVYEVRGLSPSDLQADASAWIETSLVDVAFADVTKVSLQNEHGKIELSKNELGEWTVGDLAEGKTLDTSSIDSWVRSLANLRIAEPAGLASTGGFGLDTPIATVEIAHRTPPLGDEEPVFGTVTVRLGAGVSTDTEETDGRRYAKRDGSGFAVILGKWDAEKLTDKKLDDLLEKPEEDAG